MSTLIGPAQKEAFQAILIKCTGNTIHYLYLLLNFDESLLKLWLKTPQREAHFCKVHIF